MYGNWKNKLDFAVASRDSKDIKKYLIQAGEIEPCWEAHYLQSTLLYFHAWLDTPLDSRLDDLALAIKKIDMALPMADSSEKLQETLIVLAGCCGLMMQLSVSSAIKWGRIYDGAMKKSNKILKSNPRLLFLQGMVKLKKPAVIGGGAKNARSKFVSSAYEYQRSASKKHVYGWGEAENFYWLAKCESLLGNDEASFIAYKKSLSICSGHKLANREIKGLSACTN